MLDSIANLFEDQVSPHWAAEMTKWGERVALYRKYIEGDHDVYLTNPQKNMLNLKGKSMEHFSADYTEMVSGMMSDRLKVERIDAVSVNPTPQADDNDDEMVDPLQEWVDDLLKKNRFDALQMDVHDAVCGDGSAFVIVDFDEDRQCARMHFNKAWDGDTGVLPIYSRSNPNQMMAAVKVVYVNKQQKKATVYYRDRVFYYLTDESGEGFNETDTPAVWDAKVLPVVHFKIKGKNGRSQLQKMIALQDILNSGLLDMAMTSKFTAFSTWFVKGFTPPAEVAPGDVLYYNDENVNKLQYSDAKVLPASKLDGYIQMIEKVIDLVAEITQTPIASVMGTNPSGEALKQRESGLVTKVEGGHVKLGNNWEDVLVVCHAVETTFKRQNKPPAYSMFDTQWKNANIRTDTEVIDNAGKVHDRVQSLPLYLEQVSPVYGWDEQRRKQILAQQAAQTADVMAGYSNLLGGNSNVFDFSSQLNGVGQESGLAS